ncbi:MAG: coproporphyrinogen III oxidase [Piptocephalis tieghemiana]|nr:MAG: coproporphyrinogen III oxidase [Piptocephalis tieghemiana]
MKMVVAYRQVRIPGQSVMTSEDSPRRERMERFIKQLQRDIVTEISRRDGSIFELDSWKRPEGGEGLSCVLQDGVHFDKAGVNISIIHGSMGKAGIQQMRARGHQDLDPEKAPYSFYAAGISLVLHPKNPHAPTVHANFRYFEIDLGKEGKEPLAWFGGGADLTPSYLSSTDAIHFHRTFKKACDQHPGVADYAEWKEWCDRYFWIPHRGEARGVGGIFFDDLPASEESFAAVQTLGKAFLPAYLPILDRRYKLPYTMEEKRWQQLRRGRYVEFNLVHDRGTKFGLATPGARIESILMSLPLTARWEYMHEVFPGTREEALLKVLKDPKDWIKVGEMKV